MPHRCTFQMSCENNLQVEADKVFEVKLLIFTDLQSKKGDVSQSI